jgi:hypothetical protein
MVVRYFVGLVLTVIVFTFICLASGFGSDFALLFDVPSVLIVIIFPLIFQGIMNGWKNIGIAFSIISDKNVNKIVLLNAKVFFENYGKTIFSIAFITIILSFMAIMINRGNINVAMLWISSNRPYITITSVLLYVGMINMLIIIPYKIIIKKKIMEIEN